MDREYESNMGIAHKCEAVGEERSCETCQESQRQRCPYLHRLGCTVFTPGQARAVGSLCRFYAVRFVSSATQYKLVHPDGRVEVLPLKEVMKAEPEPMGFEKAWRKNAGAAQRIFYQEAEVALARNMYEAGVNDRRKFEEAYRKAEGRRCCKAERVRVIGDMKKWAYDVRIDGGTQSDGGRPIYVKYDEVVAYLDKLGGAG